MTQAALHGSEQRDFMRGTPAKSAMWNRKLCPAQGP